MIDEIMAHIPRYIKNIDINEELAPPISMNMESSRYSEFKHHNINEKSLAMAYVPCQEWRKIYSPEVAIKRGTLFSELDKPFLGEEAISNV